MKSLHLPHGVPFNTIVVAAATLAAVAVIPLTGYWGHVSMPKAQLPEPESEVLFTIKGRVSTFGGPEDPMAGSTEVLALFETHYETRDRQAREYFLSEPTRQAKGTMRRLDPDTFYVACRWDYSKASKKQLRESFVTVTNPKNGKSAKAKPVDWGPHRSTGRAVDISPGLAKHLGVKSDEIVLVTYEVER